MSAIVSRDTNRSMDLGVPEGELYEAAGEEERLLTCRKSADEDFLFAEELRAVLRVVHRNLVGVFDDPAEGDRDGECVFWRCFELIYEQLGHSQSTTIGSPTDQYFLEVGVSVFDRHVEVDRRCLEQPIRTRRRRRFELDCAQPAAVFRDLQEQRPVLIRGPRMTVLLEEVQQVVSFPGRQEDGSHDCTRVFFTRVAAISAGIQRASSRGQCREADRLPDRLRTPRSSRRMSRTVRTTSPFPRSRST